MILATTSEDFWPTVIVLMLGFGIQQITARVRSKRQAKKIEQIHVLVNSRLTEALDKIAAFEKRLGLQSGDDPNAVSPDRAVVPIIKPEPTDSDAKVDPKPAEPLPTEGKS